MTTRTSLPTLGIDPESRLEFEYAGRTMTGAAGDSLASAMFANRVRVFSRSIKYHRPRGLFSLDGESGNCLMEVDGLANVRAETAPLRAGMRVAPQNVWGTPEKDRYGLLDRFARFMPAGFYYRHFHKPYGLWPFFMKRITRMAGIGRLNESWEPARAAELYLNADVCVAGGGPAGLAAALAAAEQGLRVVVFEARPRPGGCWDWRVEPGPGGAPLYRQAASLAGQVQSHENIRVFTGAPITGIWGDNQVTAVETGGPDRDFDERYIEVRAGSLVVATGCTERPLVFEHNERPGVMLPSCAWRLARTYGLAPGIRAVFAVGDDLGLEAAADLAGLGVLVLAVADARPGGAGDAERLAALARRNIAYLPGWTAIRARGGDHVARVDLAELKGGRRFSFDCDLLAASAGASPVIGPLSVAGAELALDAHTRFFLPRVLPPRVHAAGRMLGLTDPGAVLASGRLAGLSAAAEQGAHVGPLLGEAKADLAARPGPAAGCALTIAPVGDREAKAFVCFDEDATLKNIRQSVEAGFDMPELAKRWSAAGTGPGQGGIPGHNLPLVLAAMTEQGGESAPPTTIRPPLVPVLINTLAGDRPHLFKRTPLDGILEQAGAVFRPAGVWRRPRWFGQDPTGREEIAAVRSGVGLIDVSTLGKFRVFGPDARKALDRVYIGDMETVSPGRLKYSAMLNDDGCLLDDGVITVVGDNDYFLTTTTGRAGQTAEWLRYHAKEESWDFHIVDLTDALAGVNLAGPRSREVLAKLTDLDLSDAAFPYMGYRETTLAGGIPARVLRVGFVGERSYEIHVPASMAAALWERVMEAGAEFGIRPFGLEAQNVLRLEKGHVIVGQESEIRTNLHDLGMAGLWARHRGDAKKVGAPALRFAESQAGRMKLVGFELEENASLPGDGSAIVDTRIQGHVCTARFSPALGRIIGLALVPDHLAREGTHLGIFTESAGLDRIGAKVVPTPFYDPEGRRLRS